MSLEERIQEPLKEGERLLARTWKTIALSGLAAIAFGVVILSWPGIGLTALIAMFGAFALVIGLALVAGGANKSVPRRARAWLVFDGLLAIAVAVVVLVWPDLTARALLFAIAAWAIAVGVVELLLGAVVLPLTGARGLLLMLGGLLSAAFGVIMFARPGAGALALLALIAAFAIVTGVLQVAYALELRRVVAELEQRFGPRTTASAARHSWTRRLRAPKSATAK